MQVFADNAIPGISHCLIQDAFPEGEWDDSLGIDLGGNIAADPRFVSTPDPSGMGGNLRLRSNSPARDSGDNQWISGVSKDILGQARIVRNRVDMGAYEYQTPPSPPPPPPVSTEPTLERLGGKDRIETAVEISKAGWTSSDKVFLARSDDFADSLAGVPLAYKENAPILLTKPQLLPQATRAEIQRLGADTVVILGGKEAVSPAVEQELKKMGLVVQRVSGANRFATAAAIAALVAPEGCAEIALVNGRTFADALSVAAYAADKGMPILLTEVRVIPGETKAAISGLEADSVLVVGGISVVSAGSLKDLDNYLRVAGPDRYATAIALAEHFNPPSERIFVATGLDFPDCLTGAVLAAKEGCGLILINGDIPAVVKNYLAGKDVQTFTVLGGVLAVSPETAQKLIN